MADGGNSSSSDGGWWGSLWSAAKQQTEKVCEMVSHDLAEFTATMQTDTRKVVEKTKETLQTSTEGSVNQNTTERMKQSFHSLMTGITKALTVEPEDTSPPKPHLPQPATGIFDRAKARLRAIQTDTGTYLHEPSGPLEKYADWLKSFDLDAHKGEISDLLVTMVEVRSLYTSLVPSEVSHQDFWHRYFYKVHQLEVDEARKKALMKRAERSEIKEDSIGWDEEEDWSDSEDASPSKKSSPSVRPEDPSARLQPSGTEGKQSEATLQASSGKGTDDETLRTNSHNQSGENENSENQSADNVPSVMEQKPGTRLKQSGSVTCETSDTNNSESENTGASAKVDEQPAETVNKEKTTQNDIVKDDTGNKTEDIVVDEAKLSNVTPISEIENKSNEQLKDKIENTEKSDVDKKGDTNTAEKSDVKAETKTEESQNEGEKELKTKLKGDMVVVGERISPSSESSGSKESGTDDWEQDFDIEVTAEDMAAASELAHKLNMSAADYSKLTGDDEEDWENWE